MLKMPRRPVQVDTELTVISRLSIKSLTANNCITCSYSSNSVCQKILTAFDMFQVPIARVFSLIDMPDKYMQTFSVFELQQLVNNQLILG